MCIQMLKLPAPNKGPPWIVGGTLFWTLGVDLNSGTGRIFLPFSLKILFKKGGWISNLTFL